MHALEHAEEHARVCGGEQHALVLQERRGVGEHDGGPAHGHERVAEEGHGVRRCRADVARRAPSVERGEADGELKPVCEYTGWGALQGVQRGCYVRNELGKLVRACRGRGAKREQGWVSGGSVEIRTRQDVP